MTLGRVVRQMPGQQVPADARVPEARFANCSRTLPLTFSKDYIKYLNYFIAVVEDLKSEDVIS